LSTVDSKTLDAEELMHLALREAGQNHTDKAIAHLKQLLDAEPQNGRAWYLIGALHAEIGLYDRAVEEMHKAVELDSDLPAASFQLGLLYMTSGRADEADSAWQALDRLGEDSSFYLFKRGLLHLAANEYQACIDDLKRGMAMNADNPNLNIDMQRIAGNAQKLIDESPTQDSSQETADRDSLLAAYRRSNFDSEY